jgi:hypothetical protein
MKIDLFGIQDLNMVEFNISGDHSDFPRLNESSKFMDSNVFKLFIESFEKANPHYEFYGATKYTARTIIPLYNNLKEQLEEWKSIQCEDDFIDCVGLKNMGKHFMARLAKNDDMWIENWDVYTKKLIEVNVSLLKLVDHCVEEGRILWVSGY